MHAINLFFFKTFVFYSILFDCFKELDDCSVRLFETCLKQNVLNKTAPVVIGAFIKWPCSRTVAIVTMYNKNIIVHAGTLIDGDVVRRF